MRRTIGLGILVIGLTLSLAATARAQALVYMPATQTDSCVDPTQTGCTQGVVVVYDATSLAAQWTYTIWRHQPWPQILDLAATRGNPLYLLVKTSATAYSFVAFDTIDGATRTLGGGSLTAGYAIKIAADRSRIGWQNGTKIEMLDGSTEQVIGEIALGPDDLEMAMTPDGRYVYVAGPNRIDRYDASTLQASGTIAQSFFRKPVLSPDGTLILGTNYSQSVFVINAVDMTLMRTIPAAPLGSLCVEGLRDVTFVHGLAYVLCGSDMGLIGKVFFVDISSGQLMGTTPNLDDPWEMLPTTDESQLLVGVFGLSNVSVIDTRTNVVRYVAKLAPSGVGYLRAAPIVASSALAIDTPSVSTSATLAEPFDVAGWAVNPPGYAGPGIDAVHVWAFPASGASPTFLGEDYGKPRTDIENIYGPLYLNSGFRVTVRGLVPGSYQLAAFAHSTRSGTFSLVRTLQATIGTSPHLSIDIPGDGAHLSAPVTIAGWAADLAALSGTGIDAVHVWAYPASGSPVFLGAATLGFSRPDVAAIYGAQFGASGYSLTSSILPAGDYVIAVLARSTLTGRFSVYQAIRLTVTP